jgi:hypothetical protein
VRRNVRGQGHQGVWTHNKCLSFWGEGAPTDYINDRDEGGEWECVGVGEEGGSPRAISVGAKTGSTFFPDTRPHRWYKFHPHATRVPSSRRPNLW